MSVQTLLTEDELREIDREIALLPEKRAACIEALKVVQHHRRWVSDDCVEAIAGYLGISAAEVDSVATFYNLIFRKPVGRHVILLCDSISCYVMGYPDLYRHLHEKLNISFGETTPDNRFTLLPNACLGTCDHAPALMINNELYRDLTCAKLDEILQEYR